MVSMNLPHIKLNLIKHRCSRRISNFLQLIVNPETILGILSLSPFLSDLNTGQIKSRTYYQTHLSELLLKDSATRLLIINTLLSPNVTNVLVFHVFFNLFFELFVNLFQGN